ncbi:MAG: hypothetical protein MI920_17320 [Kiloniellales bacterium]|nr:hypothetical protein [Kiloniellales bacterium]
MTSGALAPAQLALGRFAQAVGANVDTRAIASAEGFNSAVNRVVLSQTSALKGQLSDRDVRFLEATAPQLSNTPGGNRLIIDYLRRLNDRAVLRARRMADFAQQNRSLNPPGQSSFFQEWRAFEQQNPVFTREDQVQANAVATGSPVPGAAAASPGPGTVSEDAKTLLQELNF